MKGFSWWTVAEVAIGVLLLFVLVKAIYSSLPTQVQTYIPNALKS